MTNTAQAIALLSSEYIIASILIGVSTTMLLYSVVVLADSRSSPLPDFKTGKGVLDLAFSLLFGVILCCVSLVYSALSESYKTVDVQTKTLTMTDAFFGKRSTVYAKASDGTEYDFLLSQRWCQQKPYVDVGFQFQAEYATSKSNLTGKTKSAFNVDKITEQFCQ